ncbi:MAG: DNA double-strand break repair nuclease NurA [Chloroflexi bacterium]|nr:DNA double-strand break repair nuclease NurA [Chloroflexota bacterium]MBI4505650.1 DNA double-strand break repair nuclease NurA [Chloroflexota bacterium]
MTLDLAALAAQLRGAQERLRGAQERRRTREQAAAEALALVRDRPLPLAVRARPGFSPPQALESLDRRVPVPAAPQRYSVVATDGSQIAPDPHGALLYYVINVGRVALHYGDARAHLDSRPTFTCAEDDLFASVEEQVETPDRRPQPERAGEHYARVRERRELLDEHLLATKRKVAEMRALVAFVREQRADAPLLALQDGSLIMTEHESLGRAGFVQPPLLRDYVAALRELVEEPVPVAGYISRPRSDIVAGLLRAAVCQHDDATWREGCRAEPAALCARLAGATDDEVVAAIGLQPGERSARFRSRWREARAGEPAMEIDFFFLHSGSEIARVQLPADLADDAALLDFTHAALMDQCRRGDGYPPALAEAHEQAIIRAGDRRAFVALVEDDLARLGLPASPSAKQRAKDRRAL